MRLATVTNAHDVVRDLESGAVLPKSDSGYKAYVAARKQFEELQKAKDETAALRLEVSSMQSDIGSIKDMLSQLLKR